DSHSSAPRRGERPPGFFFGGTIGTGFGGGGRLVFRKTGGLVLPPLQSSGEVTFFSRSRNKLWRKGEQSGHVLRVREMRVDCDVDALLIRVEAVGPGVCHEGYRSCFFRRLSDGGAAEVE